MQLAHSITKTTRRGEAEDYGWPAIQWIQTTVQFFAVCGPKYTKLGDSTRETLQFTTPFSNLRCLVTVWRYWQ